MSSCDKSIRRYDPERVTKLRNQRCYYGIWKFVESADDFWSGSKSRYIRQAGTDRFVSGSVERAVVI